MVLLRGCGVFGINKVFWEKKGKRKNRKEKDKAKPRNLLSMYWQKYVCLLKYFNAFPPPPELHVISILVFPLEIKREHKLYAYVYVIEHLMIGLKENTS